jgi:hypothetical protein
VVPAGQPLGLVMEFVASRPVDDLVFGYSVHSGDGVRIVECRSTETYGALRRLEPGKYSVECSIPVPLNAGLYSLHVGARCAVKALDHLPDVMTFRVDPSERLDSLWLQATTGFLLLRSRWALPTPVSGGAG